MTLFKFFEVESHSKVKIDSVLKKNDSIFNLKNEILFFRVRFALKVF